MRQWCSIFLLAGLAAAPIGCKRQPAAPRRKSAAPPAPVAVRPFEFGSPDVVLLVTGETDGMLEVCACVTTLPGGMAYRSGLAASYRAAFDHTLLIDSGDALVGTDDAQGTEPKGLRNRFVAEGYRLLGYDVLVMGQQEWEVPPDELAKLMSGPRPAFLSTTIAPVGSADRLPIRRVAKWDWGKVKLAVVSHIRLDDFLLFPERRLGQLRDSPARGRQLIEQLKRDGYAVVVVAFGDRQDVEQATRSLPADLIIRGRTLESARTIRYVNDKAMVEVGGAETVGVVGLKIAGGQITAAEYRLELLDDRWPADRRLRRLYARFLKEQVAPAAVEKEGVSRGGRR